MRIYFLLFFAILLTACKPHTKPAASNSAGQADRLDSEIAQSKLYEEMKEKRIDDLRKAYRKTTDGKNQTEILGEIINEFNSYNADSTQHYIRLALTHPYTAAHPDLQTALSIKQADSFAHSGWFTEALATMDSIRRRPLPEEFKEDFYATYCIIYQYMSESMSHHGLGDKYEKLRSIYVDSLKMISSPSSFNYLVYVPAEQGRKNGVRDMIPLLQKELDSNRYHSGMREYSILNSIIADLYKADGKQDLYRSYLLEAALSDVRGAVKENMSFCALANVMFEDGDIERANRYLKKSIADANFYSAIMRNTQSARILPMIDEAYTKSQNELTSRIKIEAWSAFVLSLILLCFLSFIWRQMQRLKKANAKIRETNSRLRHISEELKTANKNLETANQNLETTNNKLSESNRTTEEYVGLFMENCSSAISTLQSYQKSLKILSKQSTTKAALQTKLESDDMSERLLKDFNLKFDKAVLQLYPDFIDKFNSLLLPGEQVVPKQGEVLNTELRLYALIRIGINDNNKIAQFLRCSISTVYTYRSKIRRRALSPDTFEGDVRKIN